MAPAELTGFLTELVATSTTWRPLLRALTADPNADGKMEARVLLEVTCPMASLSSTAGWEWAFTLGRRVPTKRWGPHLGAPRAGPSRRCLALKIPSCTWVRDFLSKRFRELYGMGIPSTFKLTHVGKDFSCLEPWNQRITGEINETPSFQRSNLPLLERAKHQFIY